jgi:hypothetical protein
MPVQLAVQTFEKSSLSEKEDSPPVTALARYPSKHRAARTLGVSPSVRAKRSAFGALVSFIEVPQSIEVPLCGTFNFSRFSFSSFQTFSKNQHTSCTSGTAARCHLKLSRQREPQMTMHTPVPRGALPLTSNGHC